MSKILGSFVSLPVFFFRSKEETLFSF